MEMITSVLANDWYTREQQLDCLAEELDREEIRSLAYDDFQRLNRQIAELTQTNIELHQKIVSLYSERSNTHVTQTHTRL